MGYKPRAGGRYVIPIDSTGAELTNAGPPGEFTLTAGAHYYYVLGGSAAPFQSVHLTGYTAGLIITSATIQDCNHDERDVTNQSTVAGEWAPETPPTGYVGPTGTGWTATNGVVAAAGTGVGGAVIHIAETGAYRTRLDVLVGGTGGKLRVSFHGKD